MNFRKFKKSTKALSPVVASIILIAVTVAVSVVVAAWMGGMTIGLMGNAEQVSITNYSFDALGTTVTIDVRNTGTATVNLASATIDGVKVTVMDPDFGDTANIDKGTTATFDLTKPGVAFNAGAQYSIKLVTAKGTTIPYTITYNP
jgi:archaeal type IV pilus assembly protein PilA